MKSLYLESGQSYVVGTRPEQGRPFTSEKEQPAKANGKPYDESHALTTHSDPADRSGGLHTRMTTSDLERHLVRAIAVRTSGRVQSLKVQVLGERTVLSGFSESYHAVQLAVAALKETLDALGLDHPGRVDLNVDVVPGRWVTP